jgi:hypothetical protein
MKLRLTLRRGDSSRNSMYAWLITLRVRAFRLPAGRQLKL